MMLYLESFIHRVELAEIVSRWIVNRPQPEDVVRLKQIINFNSYIARLWVDRLAHELIDNLHGKVAKSFVAKNKGELKDLIVLNPPYTNARMDDLFAHYRRFPEDFYRDTPFDGRCYYFDDGDKPRYVGSTRIKRFRRIAEKGSRRIIDYMSERIRANADALAEDRARRLGIAKEELITPQHEQVEEFLHAERRLLKSIRQGSIQAEFPILSIPDVVGIKLLCEDDQRSRLLEIIERHPSCTLLEREQHIGRYNALNLRVAYVVPRDFLAANPPGPRQIEILQSRGIDAGTVLRQYQEFLVTSADHVLLEIIASNYSELLESEIGLSMHEDRILKQRAESDYSSHIATNILYLMDYILTLCLAPEGRPVTEVPIKLWFKYMPDTLDRLHRALYRLPIDASLDDPDGNHREKSPFSSARTQGDVENTALQARALSILPGPDKKSEERSLAKDSSPSNRDERPSAGTPAVK